LRLNSQALLGAFVLTGILACAAPPDQAPRPEAQNEPPTTRAEDRPQGDQAQMDEAMRVLREHEARAAVEEGRQKNLERQRQTAHDIRSLAAALFGWLNHAVEQGGVGHREMRKATADVQEYPLVSQADLERLLVPKYISRIPTEDAWGHPYEVRVKENDVFSDHVFLIRSSGRDGTYSTDSYTPGSFDANDFDEDLVWANGMFVRWPETL
jgi:hypothetical protein